MPILWVGNEATSKSPKSPALTAGSNKLAKMDFLQTTSPLSPLSKMERGLKTNLKTSFLPLLQIGEGRAEARPYRGDEVQQLTIEIVLYG